MTRQQSYQKGLTRRKKGFERTSGLLQGQIKRVGESRGFAVSRLLTHWSEIVGEETARSALPVKITYGRGGLGATLTVLTTGAHAPMLQASLPRIQEKVNVCYGYSAISRIKITQTAPTGFSEGKVIFGHAPKPSKPAPSAEAVNTARQVAAPVQNSDLRSALEALGQNVISRSKR